MLHWNPWQPHQEEQQRLGQRPAASGHELNRIRCNPTQPEAAMPAGKVMKGVFLPSGLVFNWYNSEAQIPERNCLFYIQVSPVQNTCGLSSFDALKTCLLLSSLQAVRIRPSAHVRQDMHVAVTWASRGLNSKRPKQQIDAGALRNYVLNATRAGYKIKFNTLYIYRNSPTHA